MARVACRLRGADAASKPLEDYALIGNMIFAALRSRSGGEPCPDGVPVAGMVQTLPVPLRQRALARGRCTFAHHPETPYLQADGRHRRSAQDFHARGAGRAPKLGQPLLLAPGLCPHALCAAQSGYREEAVAWRQWLLRVGNFPQGFSNIGLIKMVCNLIDGHGPAEQRAQARAVGGPAAQGAKALL